MRPKFTCTSPCLSRSHSDSSPSLCATLICRLIVNYCLDRSVWMATLASGPVFHAEAGEASLFVCSLFISPSLSAIFQAGSLHCVIVYLNSGSCRSGNDERSSRRSVCRVPCPVALMAGTFDNIRQMIYVTLLICVSLLIGLDECSQMTRYAGRANVRKKCWQIHSQMRIQSEFEYESECKTRADNMEINFYCHFYCSC